MAKKHWLPDDLDGKREWLDNFDGKIAGYETLLNIPPAIIDFSHKAKDYSDFMFGKLILLRADVKELTKHQNIFFDGTLDDMTEEGFPAFPNFTTRGTPPPSVDKPVFLTLTKVVKDIKNHGNYSDDIGIDLMIIGADEPVPAEDYKPVLKVKVIGDQIKFNWKKGKFTSINIFADKGDGRGYVLLANTVNPKFSYPNPLAHGDAPQVWKVKGQYKVGDTPFGDFSDQVTVTFSSSF